MIGEVQREMVTFRGKAYWILLTGLPFWLQLFTGSHHKGGSYDVVCYSCRSEPVKLKIVSLIGTVQMHFINTLTAGPPSGMCLSAYISLAC